MSLADQITTTLANECGWHESDNCPHCAETLTRLRLNGWTDAEILTDIELYRDDYPTWEAKVRARAEAKRQAKRGAGA